MSEIKYFDYNNPEEYLNKTKEFESLLQQKGFQVFLYGGTLLGSIRSNDLIPHDDDIDIFYISKEKHRKAVLNEFEMVVRPLLEKDGWEIKPISWSLNGPRVMMGQYHIVKNNISLDVWTAWFNKNDKFNVTMTVENHFTKKDILPAKRTIIRGFEFNAPNNYEEFLTHLYGENWLVPDSSYKIPSNKNFLQKKITKIIDQFGWAYYFIAKEQQKYSYHDISYQRIKDVKQDVFNSDIVYFHSPGLDLKNINRIIQENIDRKKTKIIGAYGGEHPAKYVHSDLIVTISFPYLYKLKEMYPDKSCIFLPEAIDTEFFNTKRRKRKSFTVGYVGRPCKVKRMHLLDELKYDVQKHAEWGPQYFYEGRTLDNVKEFYKSIDCLVLTSQSECMPRVVLEAMAMGLPVVSTDVGCLRMLIEPEWIVPNTSENDIIKNINDRLDILKKYPQIRQAVGKRNRKYIEDNFNWEEIQQTWDDVCNALVVNDYEKINAIGEELENTWKGFYADYIKANRQDLIAPAPIVSLPPEVKVTADIKKIKEDLSTIISDKIILNTTCRQIINTHKIPESEIYMGGDDVELQKIREELLNSGFYEERANTYKNNSYTIYLQSYSGKTKNYGCQGIHFKVPYPVVGYLSRHFGKEWQTLDK